MKTVSAKKESISREWYVVDATDKTLGRLSTAIANRLRGKHKPEYTPHVDTGDYIVVVNAEKVRVTGNKKTDKIYHHHTGYPGGIKETTPQSLHKSKPGEALKLAVKRMLPGGALAKKQLTKLKMYSGDKHPHEAQNLQILELSKLNSKNLIRN